MIKVENYPNAYKEVYVILENMSKEDYNKIPETFIKMVKNNMNEEYEFKLDENKEFIEQDLLQETRVILAYIFLNFWSTDEQKEKIENKFRQDIVEWEEQKEKYNSEEIFKNRKKTNQISKEENKKEQENVSMVEYKEKNIFIKIIDIFKKLFGIK